MSNAIERAPVMHVRFGSVSGAGGHVNAIRSRALNLTWRSGCVAGKTLATNGLCSYDLSQVERVLITGDHDRLQSAKTVRRALRKRKLLHCIRNTCRKKEEKNIRQPLFLFPCKNANPQKTRPVRSLLPAPNIHRRLGKGRSDEGFQAAAKLTAPHSRSQ